MKLTKQQLQRIIREEIKNEGIGMPDPGPLKSEIDYIRTIYEVITQIYDMPEEEKQKIVSLLAKINTIPEEYREDVSSILNAPEFLDKTALSWVGRISNRIWNPNIRNWVANKLFDLAGIKKSDAGIGTEGPAGGHEGCCHPMAKCVITPDLSCWEDYKKLSPEEYAKKYENFRADARRAVEAGAVGHKGSFPTGQWKGSSK